VIAFTPRGSVLLLKIIQISLSGVFINIAPSGFERFFAEAAEGWAQPEPDMTRIAAIAEKTDFNPREVRGKRYLCAQLHRNIRGLPGPPSPITSAPMVSFGPLANKIAMSTISGICLAGVDASK
jgi:hypothetical protein